MINPLGEAGVSRLKRIPLTYLIWEGLLIVSTYNSESFIDPSSYQGFIGHAVLSRY